MYFYRLTLCFLTFVSSVFANNPSESKDTVKIGVIVPLTGGLAMRGDDISKLLPVMQDNLNSQGLKYKYQFIIEDGKCGAGNVTTSAASKLIDFDKVKFLITGCSGETLQSAPMAEKNNVVLIAALSLHPEIKSLGDYIFRTYIDVEKSVNAFADFMDAESAGKIAILTEENAFTFGIRDLLLKHLGSKVIFADDFAADSADFNTLLAKINKKEAKGIYLNVMSEGTLSKLVNQSKRLGLKQKLFSYNMPEIPAFRAATGSNSDNLYFIGTPEELNSSDEFNLVLKQFWNRNPQGPSYEFVLRTTFDAAKSIVDAVEKVGNDSVKVKDYLYTYQTQGALGKVQYDSNGDIMNLHFVLKRMSENGKPEVVSELVKNE